MILHMDIDAFFASVEKLLVPALAPKPVAVGSGCIASCCYVARRYGLRAGMSLAEARRRCPRLVVLPGRQPVYKAFAERAWDVAARYSPSVEAHLDDAYLDLAGTERLHGEPERVARCLKRDVGRETGLVVTVGVAPSRTVARLAGKSAKPGAPAGMSPTGATTVPGTRTAFGRFMSPTVTVSRRGFRVIRPEEVQGFLDPLPVGQIPGVGPKTSELFAKLNIHTVAELKRLSLDQLASLFHGSRRLGECIYERARGRDTVAVSPREVPSTISRRTTFHKETSDPEELRGMLFYLCERAAKGVRELGLAARTLGVVISYADFQVAGRPCQKGPGFTTGLHRPVDTAREMFEMARALFERARTRRVAVRLVGVELSRLVPAEPEGLPLFEKMLSRRAARGDMYPERRRGATERGWLRAVCKTGTCPPTSYRGSGDTNRLRQVHVPDRYPPDPRREERLACALDDVRGRFGFGAVVAGPSISLLDPTKRRLERDRNGFVLRTPCLTK